jgi:hypothetical protein
MAYWPLWILLLAVGCSSDEQKHYRETRIANRVYAPVARQPIPTKPISSNKLIRSAYPWERSLIGDHPRITKDFFRCQGSGSNPARFVERNSGNTERLTDCSGAEGHSLPLRNGREFIYPILADLLNHIQESTGKKAVITCGHRCPLHNTYVDPSTGNSTSKHQVGAEVDFYVLGLENDPEEVVRLLMDYFSSSEDPQLTTWARYEGEDTNVTIPPWYNKEVFIKLFQSHEGRELDNRHLYPYISVQVRWDRHGQERVAYTWKGAHQGYDKWY